jgi:hypothetical protein
VTELKPPAPGASLVLSLFPGIDLLGRGFELEGFSIVRGPDLIFGGDVRTFSVPRGRFDGVIGGSPCPDFSRARRAPPIWVAARGPLSRGTSRLSGQSAGEGAR